MKRILAILLVIACIFSVCACNNNETPDNGGSGNNGNTDGVKTNAEILAMYSDLLAVSVPTKSEVVTTEKFGRNLLKNTVTLTSGEVDGKKSAYLVINEQKFNSLDSRELSLIDENTETQWYLEGSGISTNNGRTWKADGKDFSQVAGSLRLGLDEANFTSITFDEATMTLTLEASYETAADVLSAYIPKSFEYEYDTVITIVAAGGRISKIKVEYVIEEEDIGEIGSSVTLEETTVVIDASYYYDIYDITVGKR